MQVACRNFLRHSQNSISMLLQQDNPLAPRINRGGQLQVNYACPENRFVIPEKAKKSGEIRRHNTICSQTFNTEQRIKEAMGQANSPFSFVPGLPQRLTAMIFTSTM